jgi:LAS superfamily LD-carboxypeptidase LdcB
MLKPSDIGGFLVALLIAVAVAGVVLWRVAQRAPSRPVPAEAPPAVRVEAAGCSVQGWDAAARANAASLETLAWAPFGRPESGWATYAPLVAREIGTSCPPASARFAERYAAWQSSLRKPVDGVFKPDDFVAIRNALALRRPFVQRTSKGECPAAPVESTLAAARADEVYGGKTVLLRPAALAAYRRMVAAAHADGVAKRAPRLALVSGFRGPAEEAARCMDDACDTVSRARCSAHRTGLAVDLYLEPAPGQDPISTADENRRHMAATPEYRWLVANADRFGFLPYAFEPWHWEWTGEPP